MFIKSCAYLGLCNGTGVRLFLYHSDTEQGYARFFDWGKEVPYMQAYLDCFSAYPVLHPQHPYFSGKVGQAEQHTANQAAQHEGYCSLPATLLPAQELAVAHGYCHGC